MSGCEVGDVGVRAEERLQTLKIEVSQLAEALAAMSVAAVGTRREAAAAQVTPLGIRAMIKARSMRSAYISNVPLGDPAWEVLLDLLAARLENKQVSASSLCIAAGIPSSSAMRLIDTLANRGVVIRSRDPRDARRTFIELSNTCESQLRNYLRVAQKISSPLI
ncbi:MAG TPA: hypothetical protein VEA61_09245 [Allosphingosinicella sp.]|nr:hypothetical protein [Allosphingosinicella sp.]